MRDHLSGVLKGVPQNVLRAFGQARGWRRNRHHARARFIIDRFRIFAPLGGGTYEAIEELTITSANQTFPFIQHLLSCLGPQNSIRQMSAEEFCATAGERERAMQLKDLLDRYGSDKATVHNYHLLYGTILRAPDVITAVLEVGLGTNHVEVAANMGERGRPGASVRAFRDFLPNARIYGGDIDRRILFTDERIQTCFVDQTNLSSFDSLEGLNSSEPYDLIIDDGLHSPNANIAVLAFAITRVKVNGWVVIEDIRPEAISIWQTIGALLPARFESYLFATKAGPAFGVKRVQ